MQKGDRVEYTGPHTPWRGHKGTVCAVETPFDHRPEYRLFKVKWDDPPEQLPYAFITDYNRKQWSLLDDPRRNDREIYPAP